VNTPVTDYLDDHGIAFQLKEHQQSALTCESAAVERGVRVSQIVKCMVGETDRGELAVMLLPGDRRLKSSKARKWLKAGRLDLIPPDRLAAEHGLVVGAISPIQLLGKAQILMDPSVLDEELVDISSGDPMAGIELPSTVLRDLLKAEVVSIVSTSDR
jgi:Cys-tRNA(Pro) deacylase